MTTLNIPPANFAITSVGATAISLATPTGPAVQVVAFKLGSDYTTVPSPNDPDLYGTIVYTGTPSSFSLYDAQTVQVNLEVPADVLTFEYGELGLYLPGDVLFARFSYGALLTKVGPDAGGAIASVLRINALLRIAQGVSTFTILPGTSQVVIEVANLTLVNTPNTYPENPVLIVHEPNDFQESMMLYRSQSTLWGITNYSRIGTALILSSADPFHLESDYFATLYLPVSNLGRYVIQTAGGFMRTIQSISGNVATLANSMNTLPLVGQQVAVYELDTASFADLQSTVSTLVAATSNSQLYLGVANLSGANYTAASGFVGTLPDIFSVTFATANPANATLTVGTIGPFPLYDATGVLVTANLINANQNLTVLKVGSTFVVQTSPIPTKVSQLTNDLGFLTNLTGVVTSIGPATSLTNSSVGLSKLANIATSSLLGRSSAGTGVVEVLSSTTAKTLLALENLNNTSDANKPVSTAQAAADAATLAAANAYTDTNGGGGSISITDDISTNATNFVTFSTASSGTMSAIRTSSTKLLFNPSTGVFSSPIFQSLSDRNLKMNVVRLENTKPLIQGLEGVQFDWDPASGCVGTSYGFIAQDVAKVLPHAVSNLNGFYSMNYSAVIPLLVEDLKRQSALIDEQASTLKTFEERLSKLEALSMKDSK